MEVAAGTPDALCFDAVTNVGTRPTFADASFAIESHLLDFRPLDLNETTPLRLSFLARLRAGGSLCWLGQGRVGREPEANEHGEHLDRDANITFHTRASRRRRAQLAGEANRFHPPGREPTPIV